MRMRDDPHHLRVVKHDYFVHSPYFCMCASSYDSGGLLLLGAAGVCCGDDGPSRRPCSQPQELERGGRGRVSASLMDSCEVLPVTTS